MKKLLLLFATVLSLVSCEIEDDGARIVPVYSAVEATDLPDYFEKGKTYRIEVTYALPTACHQPAGLEVSRGGSSGDQRRDIYVAPVSTYDANLTQCNKEADEEDLLAEGAFTLLIDEEEPYTFYLWTGRDDNNQNQFDTVEVPVGAPDGDEDSTDTEE